jgi:hypothetical protein
MCRAANFPVFTGNFRVFKKSSGFFDFIFGFLSWQLWLCVKIPVFSPHILISSRSCKFNFYSTIIFRLQTDLEMHEFFMYPLLLGSFYEREKTHNENYLLCVPLDTFSFIVKSFREQDFEISEKPFFVTARNAGYQINLSTNSNSQVYTHFGLSDYENLSFFHPSFYNFSKVLFKDFLIELICTRCEKVIFRSSRNFFFRRNERFSFEVENCGAGSW